MTLQRNNRRARPRWVALVGFIMVFSLMGVGTTLASHPEVTLAGSNFEIDTDANLKVDDAGRLDWANVNNISKADKPTGAGDDSFGQGTKEDTAVPTVIDGSIPPNKSDLKFFGVYQEGAGSSGFLNLYWARVQDPSGTTNMDFEFNQSGTLSSNGVTNVRTAGDLLIIYDLSQGGTNPTLSLRRWTGSAWGPATDLSASLTAAGSINTSAIPAADSDGLGALSPRTFGEAQLAITSLFPDPTICQSFGSAYLKSRSSDAFNAALKDFIAPVAVNVSNCGSITIHKQDDAGTPLAGATFSLYRNIAPLGAPRGNEDTIVSGKTCTTVVITGNCTITGVLAGTYWVVETTTPAGYGTAPEQAVTVTADQTLTLTFIDPRLRGAIAIVKQAKHKDTSGATSPNLVAGFTITGGPTTVSGTITTDSSGNACVSGLLFGTYTVTETVVPTGYQGAVAQTAVVNSSGSCPTGSLTKTFVNTPLTNLTVSVSSQVSGGTASKITCTGLTPTPADGTPTAYDDTSETVNNLVPGVYTCTIDIDP